MATFILLLLMATLAAAQTPDQVCQYQLQSLQSNILKGNLTTYDYGVLLFSGKGPYQMGSRGMCETLQMRYVFLTYPPISLGMCFYPQCSSTFLNQNKENILKGLSLFLPIPQQAYPQVAFKTEEDISQDIQSEVQGGYIATTVIVVLVGAICLFGVVVQCSHIFDKKPGLDSPKTDNELIDNKSKLGLFFLSFSAWFNFKGLLKTGGKGPSYDPNLEVFAGVRTFAMMYVILGHCCAGFAGGVNNDFAGLQASWFGVFANGGVFAVDAFFLMAAFLGTYVMMNKFSQGGFVNPLLLYFHRWWRLIFPLIFTIFIGSYIFVYLMSGPLIQAYYQGITRKCEQHWWNNLFFINNLYPWDLNDECMSHAWYLANDFQFFLLLPFILMLIQKSKWLGYSLLAFLFAVSIALTSYLTIHYELYIPTPVGYTSDVYYVKPYCRIPPYLLGILLGHLYYSRKQFKQNKAPDSIGNRIFALYERSWLCTWISAILGVTLTSLITFIYHTALHGDGWTLTGAAVWNSISRFFYVFGMMLVLMPTFEGRLTWLKLFMSCEYFQVMGKLTYSAYLIHIPFGLAYIYSSKSTPYGAVDSIVYHFFGMYVMSYLAALILFLLSEYPPLNIERFILFPKKQKQDSLLPQKHIGSEIGKRVQ